MPILVSNVNQTSMLCNRFNIRGTCMYWNKYKCKLLSMAVLNTKFVQNLLLFKTESSNLINDLRNPARISKTELFSGYK